MTLRKHGCSDVSKRIATTVQPNEGANFRDESRPIFVGQAVLRPNFAGQVVLWSDHGGGKYIALTTPRFFFVCQMAKLGITTAIIR